MADGCILQYLIPGPICIIASLELIVIDQVLAV